MVEFRYVCDVINDVTSDVIIYIIPDTVAAS
jgi:hypothetical protein